MQLTTWQWVLVGYLVTVALSHITFILGRQVSFRIFRCAPKLTGAELFWMFVPGVNLWFTYLNLHFVAGGLWVLFWGDGEEIEVTDEMLEDMEIEDMEFLDEDDGYEIVFTLDDDEEQDDEEDDN